MSKTPVISRRPYFDDYNPDKKYMRILFRPQFGVQTRELTQMQTMLQDQMGRFADHFFKNGSLVIPGDVKLNKKYAYVKIKTPDYSPAVNFDALIGESITQNHGGNVISARLTAFVPAVNSDPDTLYVSYENAAVGADGKNIEQFVPGINLFIGGFEIEISTASNPVGNATAVHLNTGVYYYNSLFIPVDSQTLILKKYSDVYNNGSVGLLFREVIVTENEDSSLLDNAAGSSNFTAPGAHRLRYDAVLIDRTDVLQQDLGNFVEVLKVQEEEIAKQVAEAEYSLLEQTLARRTYDESGDYVIDTFLLDPREHLNDETNRGAFLAADGGDADKMVYDLDPGKAYVRGFEIEKRAKTRLSVNKARTSEKVFNTFANTKGAIYVDVDSITFPSAAVSTGLPVPFTFDVGTTHTKVEYTDENGVLVPSTQDAYLWGITRLVNGKYRIFLYGGGPNNQPFKGLVIRDTLSSDIILLAKNNTPTNLTLVTGDAEIASRPKIYQVSNNVIKSVSNVTLYSHGFSADVVADGSGVCTFPSPRPDMEPMADSAIFFDLSMGIGQIIQPTNITKSGQNLIVAFGAPAAGKTIQASMKLRVNTTNLIRKKERRTNVEYFSLPVTGTRTLDKVDGLKLVSVKTAATNGGTPSSSAAEQSSKFTFNGGQAHNRYNKSYITVKPGEAVDAEGNGFIRVEYEYYHRIADGYFFAADSYESAEYALNPTYVAGQGKTLELLKCLDFRPDADADVFESTFCPVYQDSELELDIEYYLPRKDKIILSSDGTLYTISGTPNVKPIAPKDVDTGITLYDIDVPAYTFNATDIAYKMRDYRRFTMSDISHIEKRIDNLEYYTTLNLLEQKTANTDIGDRLKAGFIADAFTGHDFGRYDVPEYNAAMDIENGHCRPPHALKSIDLAELSFSGLRKHDNGLMTLQYTETTEISQPLASELMRVNPFAIYSWIGMGTLNPSNDTWMDTIYAPSIQRIQDERRDINVNLGSVWQDNGWWWPNWRGWGGIWNSWGWWWGGVTRDVIRASTTFITSNTRQVDDRLVSTVAAPFIRSRLVKFKVERLKPNTRLYVFFDGVDITDLARPENGAFGDIIQTDVNGAATGEFQIPNTAKRRFLTGSRKVLFTSDQADPVGAETYAVADYTANGTINTRQATFLTTRTRTSVNTELTVFSRRPQIGWQDPLAQSFLIDNGTGAFVTSVDLFFGDASTKEPVTVQIRNMVNGYPGPDILPSAEVTLPASEINFSNNAQAKTRFTFPAPVYIQPNTEYCFVILSNSPDITCWVARMGQRNRIAANTTGENTGERISKQPYAGVLFKSQNASTWTADQEADLKFNVNVAKFSTSGNLILKNNVPASELYTLSDPYVTLLGENPFTVELDASTPIVHRLIVRQKDHGFSVGDTVRFYRVGANQASAPPIGGIAATNVLSVTNPLVTDAVAFTSVVEHTVGGVLSEDSYYINSTLPFVADGECGGGILVDGSGIYATQNVAFSTVNPIVGNYVVAGTTIGLSLQGTWRQMSDNVDTGSLSNVFSTVANHSAGTIIEGQNNTFDRSYVSKHNAVVGNTGDVKLTVTLRSTSQNLSPMIDTHRTSMVCVENHINIKGDTPTDSDGQARYITKTSALSTPANRIKVWFDADKPGNTDIEVWYRGAVDAVSLETTPWIKLEADGVLPSANNQGKFDEHVYISPAGANDFNAYAVKIVMKSAIKHRVPRIANFRAIAMYE